MVLQVVGKRQVAVWKFGPVRKVAAEAKQFSPAQKRLAARARALAVQQPEMRKPQAVLSKYD